jgi:hypothetical protein
MIDDVRGVRVEACPWRHDGHFRAPCPKAGELMMPDALVIGSMCGEQEDYFHRDNLIVK